MSGRPDRDEWHLDGTKWLSRMGDCTRRKVGALIVGPDKRFWGMGYNGSYPGGPSCLEGECPRGRHYQQAEELYVSHLGRHVAVCACNEVWPCPDAVAPGSSYGPGPGWCHSTHAEPNAKNDALRRNGGDLAGCVMYVSCEPCEECVRDIRNTTKIEAIIWPGGTVALP
jgi:dCMP deaminase